MQAKLHAQNSPLDALRGALATSASSLIEGNSFTDTGLDFAESVLRGLKAIPRYLESRFLYDTRGSLLFELITRQPEYYLTRTEASILAEFSGTIRSITGRVTLVELGSGSSEKTEHLLRAWDDGTKWVTYVAVDVSRSSLAKASTCITQRHPTVQVVGFNSTYQDAFSLLSALSPSMVIFLGSSIGNFDETETEEFLESLSTSLAPGDFFLGGFDLVKNPVLLESAYNDAAGVTAEFTRNLFHRLNRELGSGIRVEDVRHRAVYNPDSQRIEIDAVFQGSQELMIHPLGEKISILEGETIRTEISRKFKLGALVPYLESFGFRARKIFTDSREWFGIVLLQKTP